MCLTCFGPSRIARTSSFIHDGTNTAGSITYGAVNVDEANGGALGWGFAGFSGVTAVNWDEWFSSPPATTNRTAGPATAVNVDEGHSGTLPATDRISPLGPNVNVDELSGGAPVSNHRGPTLGAHVNVDEPVGIVPMSNRTSSLGANVNVDEQPGSISPPADRSLPLGFSVNVDEPVAGAPAPVERSAGADVAVNVDEPLSGALSPAERSGGSDAAVNVDEWTGGTGPLSVAENGIVTWEAGPSPVGEGSTGQTSGGDTIAGSTATTATIATGQAVVAYTNSASDTDWFRITLTAGQTYTFAAFGFGQGSLPDTELALYDASGNQLAFNDEYGQLHNSRLSYTATTSGTYYVGVGGYGTTTGQYMLTANTGSNVYYPTFTIPQISDQITHTYWEANYSSAAKWGVTNISFNVQGLEPERAVVARAAFAAWADVCGLTFTEVASGGNIVLDDEASGAYANFSRTGGTITSATINIAKDWFGGSDAIDSYTFQTYMHEIGHTLGFGHAGPYNGSATWGQDNSYANDIWQYTLMSYFDGTDPSPALASYRFTMTPMLADIYAAQSYYGASTARTGDTVYGHNSNAGSIYSFSSYTTAPSFTIWDSGGKDTLDASGYTQAQTIDLRAGNLSSIGGYVNNIAIALGVVVENAKGGSGNDTLIGNAANNVLTGNGGNDTLIGGAGFDFAAYSASSALVTYTHNASGAIVVNAGSAGTDTLTGMEILDFADRDVFLWKRSGADLIGDFSGNGRDDLLWRSSGGALAIWDNGSSGSDTRTLIGGAGFEWTARGVGDFNGDGRDDILWKSDTGTVALWLMNGSSYTGQIASGAPLSYDIAGVGDFNGDGRDDILWQDTAGNIFTWMMNGASVTATPYAGNLWSGYVIQGTGDLNGDGRDDVLIRDTATGALAFGAMNNGVISTYIGLGGTGSSWSVRGLADFNNDGVDDILFRHTDGTVAIWTMNSGGTVQAKAVVGGALNTWEIQGVGDFIAGGGADIVWKNNDTGQVAMWGMDGFTIASTASPGGASVNDWFIL